MKRSSLWAAVLVVVSALAVFPALAVPPRAPPAPATSSEPAAQGTVSSSPEARGHEIVTQSCSMCHAVGRSGLSPNGSAPPFRLLSNAYPVEDLQEALTEGIRTGHVEMPEFQFTDEEAEDIVAYLQSIQAH